MKINDYYRNAANIYLNGSIASLFPAVLIVSVNFILFNNQKVMLLSLPFFLYSIFGFQLYLYKTNQSLSIRRNLVSRKNQSGDHSLFAARELLVLFEKTFSPQIMFYYPDGNLAGRIRRNRKGRNYFKKLYVLDNLDDEVQGFFRVKGKSSVMIEVFDREKKYLGCFVKHRLSFRKNKKKLLNAAGKYIGYLEGSKAFMDEKVFDQNNQQLGRLRRGWMPLEWSSMFPDPNTPVLSFKGGIPEKDKLLYMSFLINEYFIER